MNDVLQTLKITTWYKAVIAVSAAAFLIALASQRDALAMIFGGAFLVGIGEWKNHPKKQVDFRPAAGGFMAKITDIPRKANSFGVLLQLIGVALIHRDVEVTEAAGDTRPVVSQAFCSALPVAYSNVPRPHWEAFGSLVLEAAYEATMVAAVLNARRGVSNVILLTELGAGAFGNDPARVHGAMRRALEMMRGFDLDVKLVSYRSPSRGLQQLAEEFGS